MIDSLYSQLKRAEQSSVREELRIGDADYATLTLHRPSNVDDRQTFSRILDALARIGDRLPIIFPVHPRTRACIEEFGFAEAIERVNLRLIEPLGYLDFLRLYSGARLVLTDSGGLQEETTVLGIPCLTLRENTERPITVELGTNTIVGTDTEKIVHAAFAALDSSTEQGSPRIPPLWDGHTADRILDALLEASV
jgi:UDP-N-acetylglucosamine 2-epimerase (non-hydrolysing)